MEEVIKRLGLTNRDVSRLVRDGELTPVQVDGVHYVRTDEARAISASCRPSSKPSRRTTKR